MNLVLRMADAVGDRINPIVVRELRQSVQSRFVVVGLQLLLTILILVISTTVLLSPTSGRVQLGFGAQLFSGLMFVLYFATHLIVPIYTGIRLAMEQAGNDLMFISTIKPRSIVYGKLGSAMILSLMLFSATMPFMTLCYLLRGIDIPTMFLVMGYCYLEVTVVTSLWILWGALPVNWPGRIGLGILAFILYMMVLGSGAHIEIIEELSRGGFLGSAFSTWEFWGGVATFLTAVVLVLGLVLELATCVLSPASSNRMLPLRVFLTLNFVATGVMIFLWCWFTKESEIFLAWPVLQMVLVLSFLLIAVCERDRWGLRVRRRIPKNPLLRLLALPFYTGALNGILWCVGALVLAMAGFLLFYETVGGWMASGYHPGRDEIYEMSQVLITIAFFAYAYCVTGALIRRYLLSRHMASHLTWVVVLLLLAALCAVPPIVLFVTAPNVTRLDTDSILFAANPFVMVDRYGNTRELQATFAIYWSAMATIAAVPWFIEQFARFRPIDPEEHEDLGPPPVGASPFGPDASAPAAGADRSPPIDAMAVHDLAAEEPEGDASM